MASNIISTPKTSSGAVVAQGSEPSGSPRPRAVTYYGFSYRETDSAAAVFRIRTGGASGTILDTVSLGAGESARENYQPQGLRAPDGLYFELVSGTVEGSVRHG